MKISMPFESTYNMLDFIKLASLYFDQVNVLCPMLDDYKPYFSTEIYNHMKILIDEKVVDVDYVPVFGDSSWEGWYDIVNDLALEGFTSEVDTCEIDRLMHLEWIREFIKTTGTDDDPVTECLMDYSTNLYLFSKSISSSEDV